jgi:hypothetical protein
MANENSEKISIDFYCSKCDYTTSRKADYKKHLTTDKHRRQHLANENSENSEKYRCICDKEYIYSSSLSKHKKTCKEIIKTDITTDMVLKILEQNKQLSDIIVNQNKQMNEIVVNQNDIIVNQSKQMNEMIPKIGNTNNTNNTINNNQKLNINIFLNEKCKDAMSMDNFLKTIEVSLSNLLVTKEKGLAEGITNIIVENMNKLPINQRPIHCTDVKRETIYIKNETWEKDENKEKTKEAIKKISCIQTKNIKKWTEANPNYMEKDKLKDEYIYLIKHISDDVKEKEEKIIKNICKNSYINDKLIEN